MLHYPHSTFEEIQDVISARIQDAINSDRVNVKSKLFIQFDEYDSCMMNYNYVYTFIYLNKKYKTQCLEWLKNNYKCDIIPKESVYNKIMEINCMEVVITIEK
jgi:nitrate reductase assembly molybdenum cofactor insertion protein NarJ